MSVQPANAGRDSRTAARALLLRVQAARARLVCTRSVRSRAVLAAALIVGATLAVDGCREAERSPMVPGGDVARGRRALSDVGCGSCHVIDGVPGAHGMVGPPLTGIASRSMLAGEIGNSPENMIRWIRDPQAIEPGTAMPNLDVTDQVARDMTAYLYTLH